MKKLMSIGLLMVVVVGAQAGPYRPHHFGHYHHGWHGRTSFSLHFGGHPYYSPWYSPSYAYVPAYSYYAYGPAYGYGSAYTRPNYAVGGTLFGALAGGLIGHSIDRQGWEGAGIGAAAGLVLGSIAERNARAEERAYSTAPIPTYTGTAVSQNAETVAPAPAVSETPIAPAAAQARTVQTRAPTSPMSAANALFGR